MATEQRLQRFTRRLSRPAAYALAPLRRAFGWGSGLLKRITGADQARLRPSFGRHGLGWSLSLTRRF